MLRRVSSDSDLRVEIIHHGPHTFSDKSVDCLDRTNGRIENLYCVLDSHFRENRNEAVQYLDIYENYTTEELVPLKSINNGETVVKHISVLRNMPEEHWDFILQAMGALNWSQAYYTCHGNSDDPRWLPPHIVIALNARENDDFERLQIETSTENPCG